MYRKIYIYINKQTYKKIDTLETYIRETYRRKNPYTER